MVQDINIDQYKYPLPDERIAKHPLQQRDACKLLVADSQGVKGDHVFTDLPGLLPGDAMLVYNNTRVIKARVLMHKESGAAIEIFCLEPVAPADYERNFASREPVTWRCLVGNSKKWKDGDLKLQLSVDGQPVTLTATRVGREDKSSLVQFGWTTAEGAATPTFAKVIEAAGVIPIPPYLNRDSEESDTRDYQTVFSRIDGSVAAPTAGLHFTDRVLAAIDSRGIQRQEVTLHVGAGTFRPVQTDHIGDHDMHSEYIVVGRDFIARLTEHIADGHPVYAVGTTSVRTLESLYHIGCLIHQGDWTGEVPQWYPYDAGHPHLSAPEALQSVAEWLDRQGADQLVASTRIIIAPGYRYRVVDGMVTNFHQPGSTLLLLVSAMIGDAWRPVYNHALDAGYRFLSYGDACLFTK